MAPTDEQLDALGEQVGPGIWALGRMFERDEAARVVRTEHAEPGFITLHFADGRCLAFTCGDAHPVLAEALYLAAAAVAGRLLVPRH